ncbi:small secreted protein [Diplodia corticola]|uniref:Small secreted protein n=1 Tax=Diplodia corticola TaxID=236234 RepID=A0A1J9R7R5_9PEZI|nr:small secreted protein [Diplodia corticola]OJD36242.1 small secreted protein [Diplodia corticola]
MHFATVALFLGLAASSLASPISHSANGLAKRAILSEQSYADFQISDGQAGNALQEVNQKFPVTDQDPANVSQEDQDIISKARETAEDAETGSGGFNEQIEAAGEDSDEGKALQVGKIKNKVLKLQLEVLDLQIKQAQGDDQTDKIAEEQKKLQENMQQDQDAAGQTSKSVADTFQG